MPTALISVYNKDGIVDFALSLRKLGWDIYSSGGTAKVLTSGGVQVLDVAGLVGGGAILGHRVVTLSREIHAGLLADKRSDMDLAELEKLGIPRIDLVCVDLYPLKEEIQKENSTRMSVIDKTDIGGPTLLRSAAKGERIVVCDPADRRDVLVWLENGKPDEDICIQMLGAKAEAIVSDYCLASSRYHSNGDFDGVVGVRASDLTYGENAWQNPASLYSTNLFNSSDQDPLAMEAFELIEGEYPSYNNYCDIDRALQTLTHIAAVYQADDIWMPYIAIGVKHGNVCGAAVGHNQMLVINNMAKGDPKSLFGGVVMTNFVIGEKAARMLQDVMSIAGQKPLLDAVVAPVIEEGAISCFKRANGKCRLFINTSLMSVGRASLDTSPRFRQVRGGFLRQPNYTFVLNWDKDVRSNDLLKPGQGSDMLLAWAIGSTSNSNTIALVKQGTLIANAVGQRSRSDAAILAVMLAKNAGHDISNSIAYSDSFFPFIDAPAYLAENGVAAILASSGSVNDELVKRYCRDNGVALYLVSDKAGRGFYGH